MTTFYIPGTKEEEKRYERNAIINNLIAIFFKESIADFDENKDLGYIPPVIQGNILLANDYKDVPYGGKTLGEAGCAVFCLEQGLRYRGIIVSIVKLAEDIANYYVFGKGTRHNLFDHLELGRARHFQDIFDALRMGRLVTILVENNKYSPMEAVDGSHFVNIVGQKGKSFVIDDPQMGRINVPMREIFGATRVAWIW